jgi:hypothetical protein
MTLGVLHADRRVHGAGQAEGGHVVDHRCDRQVEASRLFLQELDGRRREVQRRHPVAAPRQAQAVVTGAPVVELGRIGTVAVTPIDQSLGTKEEKRA